MSYTSDHNKESGQVKYGSFIIEDKIIQREKDPALKIRSEKSRSDFCFLEGIWNPSCLKIKKEYHTAMSGICIWGKYDCVFEFKPQGKGNPGAKRSMASPKEKKDLMRRLEKGQNIERVFITKDPFGTYQLKMIGWQADTVKRFGIQKLYYSLPFDEYRQDIKKLEKILSEKYLATINEILEKHYLMLKKRIEDTISTHIEFIYPMRSEELSVEDSYIWPYLNLDIDMGIEDLNEFTMIYRAMKKRSVFPRILMGVLKTPDPYYERRKQMEVSYRFNR